VANPAPALQRAATRRAASPAGKQDSKTIVFFGLLESAVIFCAVALIASPATWPLLAALFPLAVMALNLPSRPA